LSKLVLLVLGKLRSIVIFNLQVTEKQTLTISGGTKLRIMAHRASHVASRYAQLLQSYVWNVVLQCPTQRSSGTPQKRGAPQLYVRLIK
jgi:hypothetical protein